MLHGRKKRHQRQRKERKDWLSEDNLALNVVAAIWYPWKAPEAGVRCDAATKKDYKEVTRNLSETGVICGRLLFPGNFADVSGANKDIGLYTRYIPSGGASKPLPVVVYGNERCEKKPFTFVFFHGNGEEVFMPTVIALANETGSTVMAPEYPGYGEAKDMSHVTPKAMGEWVCRIYEWLKNDLEIDMSTVIPVGYSIGTGVAGELAALIAKGGDQKPSRPEPPAVVLIAPFTSIRRIADEKLGWWSNLFPNFLNYLVAKPFDNVDMMNQMPKETQICLVHGSEDLLIPDGHSASIAETLGGSQLERICDYEHDTDSGESRVKGLQVDTDFGEGTASCKRFLYCGCNHFDLLPHVLYPADKGLFSRLVSGLENKLTRETKEAVMKTNELAFNGNEALVNSFKKE